MNKTRLRTFLAFLLLSTTTRAQSDYLITTKADTLFGTIRILSYDNVERVQIERNKKKETFSALQILSVTKDNKIYHPVRYENKYIFMQLLKPGYLSLYGFKMAGQNTFDGRFLIKKNGTSQELPNIGFKRILGDFLGDCREVSEKIKAGDLVRTQIETIVDEYNACLNKATAAAESTPGIENQKTQAVDDFIKKVETTEFESRQDALDLLKDIRNRASKGEKVPNYLTEGLKSYIAKAPQLNSDLEVLLASLKN